MSLNLRSIRTSSVQQAQPPFQALLRRIGEEAFAIFAIFILSGVAAIGENRANTVVGSSDSNPYNSAGNVIILGYMLVWVAFNREVVIRSVKRTPLLMILVVLCTLSVVWSVSPYVTARRLIPFYTTMVFALWLIERFDVVGTIKLLGRAHLWLLVASVFFVIFVPSIGIESGYDPTHNAMSETYAGSWAGVFSQKNALGWIASAAYTIYLWRFVYEPKQRLIHGVTLLFIVFVAYKSRSTTTEASMLLSTGIMIVPWIEQLPTARRTLLELLSVIVAVGCAALLVMKAQDVTGAVGKDATLTGRIPLWIATWPSVELHPWLGYGFSAFWLTVNPEFVRIQAAVGWAPPHAHNAYLNLATDIGIPGALLGTFVMIHLIFRSVALIRKKVPWATYLLAFCTVFAVANMAETRLFHSGDNFSVMVFFAAFVLANYVAEHQPVREAIDRHWRRAMFAPDPGAGAQPASALVPAVRTPVRGGAVAKRAAPRAAPLSAKFLPLDSRTPPAEDGDGRGGLRFRT